MVLSFPSLGDIHLGRFVYIHYEKLQTCIDVGIIIITFIKNIIKETEPFTFYSLHSSLRDTEYLMVTLYKDSKFLFTTITYKPRPKIIKINISVSAVYVLIIERIKEPT